MLSLDDVIQLHLADLTYPEGHSLRREQGQVFAYIVRHPDSAVLFDTGIGGGNLNLDRLYRVIRVPLDEQLGANQLRMSEVRAVVNSHLHFDHCGGNPLFPRTPIYVQADEHRAAQERAYTVREWVEFPGAEYALLQGDAEIADGITVLSTPGHTPGHQSLLVETRDRRVVLAGQAVYSRAEYEHIDATGEIPAGDPPPDPAAYLASAQRLIRLQPRRVFFSHDPRVWEPVR